MKMKVPIFNLSSSTCPSFLSLFPLCVPVWPIHKVYLPTFITACLYLSIWIAEFLRDRSSWARRNRGDKTPLWGVAGEAPRRPHVPTGAGPHRARLFREVSVSYYDTNDMPWCHHCVECLEDTVEVCPVWVENHSVLLEVIGGGILSRPALVEAMVQVSAEACDAVTSFCEAVMQSKDGAKHERKLRAFDSRSHRRLLRPWCIRCRGTIFGHRRRWFADGKQQIVCRPIRIKPVTTERCVPPTPPGAVSKNWRGPVPGRLSTRATGIV